MATREQVNTVNPQALSGKSFTLATLNVGTLTVAVLSGCAALPPTVPLGIATKKYVDDSGGGVTPGSVLTDCETSAPPATDPQIANKKYVDDAIAAAFASVPPTIISGTPLIKNPLVNPSKTIQAHGMVSVDYLEVVLECLIADGPFAQGYTQLVNPSSHAMGLAPNKGVQLLLDAINMTLTLGAGGCAIQDPATGATVVLTSANWKLTVTPYKF